MYWTLIIVDVMQYPVEVLLGPCPRYLSQGRPHALQLSSKPYFLQDVLCVVIGSGRYSGGSIL